ncbi:amidohydrolase family protein [Arenibacter echinorum]|uniref:L-fuconolactonase n=1 Tax=Arenibacter echinorum TaxID=440515 RepID=A0A327R2G6_9FLAO|nr:amidohydrolase family protein [Arenibacter echinorum]RAJ10248.1 L-fuconolactonase [Arenibacter echinorum]
MDLALVDTHIHIWDIKELTYPWLEKMQPIVNQTYLMPDYDKAIGNQEVEAMVFVQCECKPEQFLEELHWVQNIADADMRLKGIIPWAPLHTGSAVEPILQVFKKDSRIKGVRQIIQFEDDPNFCLKPDFIRGVQLLGEYGLHFEITIDPSHFLAVMNLMEKCPDTRFILDHIGNPNIDKQQLKPWKGLIKNFADSGSHYCKFSNFLGNANLENWKMDDLKPFSEVVIESFGPDRLIWGSDWPPLLRAASWKTWLQVSDELTKGLSEQERKLVFKENAIQFYRLNQSKK